jgi:predicted outer membrane protein
MLDVDAAKEVEQKIKDPAYKAYATQVIADDSKIEDSLKSVAQAMGMTLPDRLDEQRALALKDLQSSDGAQLQQKFRASQIGGDRLTIEILRDLAQRRDPKITAWLKTALPTVQNHLEAANQLPQIPSAPRG